MKTVIAEKSVNPLPHKQDLEDRIHLQMQKLHALCVTHTLLNSQPHPVHGNVRLHYALILEEHCDELQQLLDRLFQ
ncbi:hypothetical protein [Cellvibrio polysaccharolyticus]|uniref:Uncharacterized protein n=1 Tax=Cellvibrio polysaccharolyticus TaxID=2082724 RepID=A0A928YSG4_9GAMM|nr:hypothetical protein [Cellvibrio polysaccharolyticus]MBE8715737.1 hypothetical protein [Cellvibrio polysaccharolyticus]